MKYTFKVVDYNNGDTGATLTITTLNQLNKFAQDNGYKSVWSKFDTNVLYVTKYGKFGQR